MREAQSGRPSDAVIVKIRARLDSPLPKDLTWHPSLDQIEAWERDVASRELTRMVEAHLRMCNDCLFLAASLTEHEGEETPDADDQIIAPASGPPGTYWAEVDGTHVELKQTEQGWSVALLEIGLVAEGPALEQAATALWAMIAGYRSELAEWNGEVGGRIQEHLAFLGGSKEEADRRLQHLLHTLPDRLLSGAVKGSTDVTGDAVRGLETTKCKTALARRFVDFTLRGFLRPQAGPEYSLQLVPAVMGGSRPGTA